MVKPRRAIRVAVIGTGYWGKNLVRVFADLGVLAAVCDVNREIAESLAAAHGAELRPLEDILADASIDAVAIAAPAAKHAELARIALTAGKHVFVEKPLALDVVDAEPLIALAREKRRTLMVGHLLQYHPGFRHFKHMIDEGTIGQTQYFYSNRLNLGKIRREEDILWSFAPHDISMILALTGQEPSSVSSIGSAFVTPSVADVTLTHLAFPSGSRAHIFVSWLHPYKEQRLVAVGTEGMLTFDDGLDWDAKVKLYKHRIDWIGGNPVPVKSEGERIPLVESEPLREELEHFCECIETNRTALTDGEEGLRVLRVLQRATESMLQIEENRV